uniref:Uncharacterized protein n=1 Tax=Oryza nivara TaxID=4536 RepID=A0A679BB51_ORYNI|nr:hypothetical protein [Oryza sativa f. spontanea]
MFRCYCFWMKVATSGLLKVLASVSGDWYRQMWFSRRRFAILPWRSLLGAVCMMEHAAENGINGAQQSTIRNSSTDALIQKISTFSEERVRMAALIGARGGGVYWERKTWDRPVWR